MPPDDDEPPHTDDDDPRGPPKRKRAPKPKVVRIDSPSEPPPEWAYSLRHNASNQLTKEPANAALILTHDDNWKGAIAYNEFSRTICWRKTPPPAEGLITPQGDLADHHVVYVQHWLAKYRGTLFPESAVFSAILTAAHANKFHPVREYLAGLAWDGVQRLPTWLSTYFGAPQSPYLEAVGKAWMISAVARIMRPGCKADYMLVLEGKQGARKSSALSVLFGDEWFTDSQIPIGTDEAYKKLQGKWGVEIAELDAFRGKASSQIKGFITSTKDTYRPSYGRVDQDFPRTCVFVGTTNEREYLVDRTGNRRFWPVTVGKIDRPAIQSDREQLWAEAVVRYESGEHWWLESDDLARVEQRQREVREPWFELVSAWLEDPLVRDQISTIPGQYTRLDLNDGVTQAQIFEGALRMRPSDMEPRQQQRIGFIMHKLGFVRTRPRTENSREYRYFRERS